MKHLICIILSVVLIVFTLAACSDSGKDSSDKPTEASKNLTTEKDGHPLYIRADKDPDDIAATFSSVSGADQKTVDLTVAKEEDKTDVYVCYADTKTYNRVTITINGRDSELLAFNDYTSGWELSPSRAVPFTYGKESKAPEYTRKEFSYQDRSKGVLIWTPDGYDPKSAEKYAVIYMTDGHNLFDPNMTSQGCWAVAESIDAMMSQSDNKTIVVGIENMDGWRDDELTPNLGTPTDPGYEDGHGAYFCDFLMKTVIPYVEKNYNVYTDRDHTAICGSSSGGIESFYIAMEHPEKFGTVGALSPAFSLFDNETWNKYLTKKDFSKGYPRVYIYCGEGNDLESALLPGAKDMPENLSKINYPAENIYYYTAKKALHNELYWRVIFPDFLKYLYN